MAIDRDRQVLAVGRLHLNSPAEAQIRYMAVAEMARGLGLGTALLQGLEDLARKAGVERIVLNARDQAERFYLKNGYVVTGPAPTLFSTIKHVRMAKELRS